MVAYDYLGTLPQQISAVGIVTIVGIVLRYRLGLRKLGIDEQKQHDHDEANIRDHYAKEVAALRDKLDRQETHFQTLEKHLRDMLEASDRRADESDRRHRECEQARQAMRQEMDVMHAEIAGLKRQIPEASADMLLQLEGRKPSEVAPHSVDAAKRIQNNGK